MLADTARSSMASASSSVAAGPTEQPTKTWDRYRPLHLGTSAVRAPIVYAGKQVGQLILIADLSDLRTALIESLTLSLFIGLLAAIVGVAIAHLMQRSITRPITALSETMEQVRETRDFSHRAERHSSDETGQMVDAFNDMLDQIGRRDQALAHHRDQLEATVRERTRDLHAAKTAAEEANAAKSDFLATMSHEIRTPMNGMLVMAELLSASGLAPRLQRYSDVIVKSGQGLLTIINDILDFSKIEAGKLELERVPVAPRQLVDDVLQLFSERAVSAGLDIAAHVTPDVPKTIAADPVRLNQVITNLTNNALKFTQTGGVLVRVAVVGASESPETARLRFSVTDTGIGIPEDKCATIFDAFSQADQSTTRQFGGTGIGLSICQRLVNAMEGEIGVESVVGEGSTFAFEIPVDVLEASGALAGGENHIGIIASSARHCTRRARSNPARPPLRHCRRQRFRALENRSSRLLRCRLAGA